LAEWNVTIDILDHVAANTATRSPKEVHMSIMRLATEDAEKTAAASLAASRLIVTPAPPAVTPPTPPATAAGQAGTTAQNALTALVKFIPTEIVTLYVSAVSVGTGFKSVFPSFTPALLYWSFIILTPILHYLIYFSSLASMNEERPPVGQWPRWKPLASTIAFSIWALAIPENPYIHGEAGAAVMGFLVLFVTMLLSYVTPIIERSERTA
jgi:hypothetical protein